MICPNCKNNLPQGLSVCFKCGAPLNKPVKALDSTIEKKKSNAGLTIIVSMIILAVAVFGGHYAGLYTLPFMPEKTTGNDEAGIERPEPEQPVIQTPPPVEETSQPDGPSLSEFIDDEGKRVIIFGETDDSGSRTGFWVENHFEQGTGNLVWLHEGYYTDDKLNGESKNFWVDKNVTDRFGSGFGFSSGTFTDGKRNSFTILEVYIKVEINNDPSADYVRFEDITGIDLAYAYRGNVVNEVNEDTTGNAYQMWREDDGSITEYIGGFRNNERNGQGRMWNTIQGWENVGQFENGRFIEPVLQIPPPYTPGELRTGIYISNKFEETNNPDYYPFLEIMEDYTYRFTENFYEGMAEFDGQFRFDGEYIYCIVPRNLVAFVNSDIMIFYLNSGNLIFLNEIGISMTQPGDIFVFS